MVIPKQYPHYLYVHEYGATTVLENGDRIPGESAWKLWGSCREETNGSGEVIDTSDVTAYRFHSLVQMPAGTARIAEGMEILVTDTELDVQPQTRQDISDLMRAGTVRLSGTCRKFDSGQLHCRMWV